MQLFNQSRYSLRYMVALYIMNIAISRYNIYGNLSTLIISSFNSNIESKTTGHSYVAAYNFLGTTLKDTLENFALCRYKFFLFNASYHKSKY